MDITIVTFIEKAVSNYVFFSQQKGFCQILVFHFPKKWVAREVAFLKYDLQSANELTANTWQVVITVHCAKNCAPTPVASVSLRNFEVDSSKLWHKTPPLSIETALL